MPGELALASARSGKHHHRHDLSFCRPGRSRLAAAVRGRGKAARLCAHGRGGRRFERRRHVRRGRRDRQHRKLVKRSRYRRRHCIATAAADTSHALCVDRSSQDTPEGLALRAPPDPEVRNRNRRTGWRRQVVADHGGDAVTSLGQGSHRRHSEGAAARLALEPGRPAGGNRAQDPGGSPALRAEAGRHREPAVRGQRARPAARHRDHEPGRPHDRAAGGRCAGRGDHRQEDRCPGHRPVRVVARTPRERQHRPGHGREGMGQGRRSGQLRRPPRRPHPQDGRRGSRGDDGNHPAAPRPRPTPPGWSASSTG